VVQHLVLAGIAQVKRRRRTNRLLFWTGFVAAGTGVMLGSASSSQAGTIAGQSIFVGGGLAMTAGIFRSFRQATPRSRARQAARSLSKRRR
jgi:hypothetical protein